MRSIGSSRITGLVAAGMLFLAVAPASSADTATQVRLAESQQAQGRYEESLSTLRSALAAAGEKADAAQLAAIHGAIGNALLALGPPALAREHLGRAVALARSAQAHALLAATLVNLGNLDASSGHDAEATAAYREAAALAQKAGDRALEARALLNAARSGLSAGVASDAARGELERGAKLSQELSGSREQAQLLLAAGRIYARLAAAPGTAAGRYLERAHVLLGRADAVAEAAGDARTRSYALGYLGALYEASGRTDEALALTRRALFLAQEANAPEALYRWHWQCGRLLRAKGERTEALAAYQQAVTVLRAIRFELAHGYAAGEGSFRETLGPIFFELVDLLLETAPPAADAAAHQARLLEVREVMEQLKAAELRDYFRDECVDALEAKVESLHQVSPSAVVIYPVVLPDRLELLLTSSGGVQRATIAVGAEQLGSEVRRLRFLLEKRTTRQFLPHAQRLYDWLIRPFEAEIAARGADTLVFVPDGPLRTIPLSALHDGKRFAIERWAVAISPGLSLTDPRPLDHEGLSVFLSGLSEPVQGYSSLDHVPAELAAIQKLYGGELVMNKEFRRPRVEQDLAEHEFSVVHVATHAEFSEDVESSFLLTYDGKLTLPELRSAVGQTRLRDRPIELLTLSACETAQGSERAALGLAGVAIQAGARSALGTLWSVNDEAAAALVTEFYRQLREQRVSKAAALQEAQRKLLADVNHSHPFYWAAFLLISNWL